MDIVRANALVNVFIFLSIFIMQVVEWKYTKGGWRWVKLSFGVIGLYWAVLYSYVFYADVSGINTSVFGQTFVRPALSITGAVMLLAAAYSRKSRPRP